MTGSSTRRGVGRPSRLPTKGHGRPSNPSANVRSCVCRRVASSAARGQAQGMTLCVAASEATPTSGTCCTRSNGRCPARARAVFRWARRDLLAPKRVRRARTAPREVANHPLRDAVPPSTGSGDAVFLWRRRPTAQRIGGRRKAGALARAPQELVCMATQGNVISLPRPAWFWARQRCGGTFSSYAKCN